MPELRPHTRIRLGAVAAVVLVTVGACSGTSDGNAVGRASLGHVHGLGINPADDTLYVATHLGVFTLRGGGVKRVGPAQDTMGFTVAGPDEFLGSGHPGTLAGPSSLGLISSRDKARTWKPVAFDGAADFHALDVSGPWTFAYSADWGLIRSKDLSTWKTVTRQPLYDIAANPNDANRLLVTTDQGELKAVKTGGESSAVPGAPLIGPIDYADTNLVAGLGPNGEVYVSRTGGETWRQQADLPGTSEAIDAVPGRWHAATSTGIYRSTDDGQTWKPVYRATQ